MDSADWLRQQEIETWRARLRELRHELSGERTVPPLPLSAPQEIAPVSAPGQQQKPVRIIRSRNSFG